MDLIWKTTAIYFIILIIMKIMGPREIGQLSLFDFVVLLLIADISAITIDQGKNFFLYLIPIVVLVIIQKILAFISLKFKFVRNIFDGNEKIIIYDGKLCIKEMKKNFYNVDDLLTQVRLKNVKSLSQIRYLILETNGEISIFLYDEDQKPNSLIRSKTLGVNGSTTGSYILNNNHDLKSIFPIITSGKVNYNYLKIINKDEHWLLSEIKKQGYINYNNIYYASYENERLFIIDTM
jgi:uncharacterized membrane protein YcaP (DUF421 family)